jgi:hypothetical protein
VSRVTEVEYSDAFGTWWESIGEGEQESVAHVVGLLEARGPTLGHPHSSAIAGSRCGHLRELRVQHRGRPLRVFYAFDPRRVAVLLVAGDKSGDDRFYERMIPIADRIYQEHLDQLGRGGAD